MKDKDIKHLEWVYERMKCVHNENENYDYMIRFREILEALRQPAVRQRTFSADTMEELEKIWQTELMNNGWDIEKPLDVRWNWYKFDYEYYFVAKYVA